MRSGPFAVDDFDLASMRVHELHHYRQADARALDVAGRCLASIEGFEHLLALFGGDARAAVGHFQHQVAVLGARAHVDGAAARRVLDGIGQQVLEDQPHLAAIGASPTGRRR